MKLVINQWNKSRTSPPCQGRDRVGLSQTTRGMRGFVTTSTFVFYPFIIPPHMNKTSHFSSRTSALILWAGLMASVSIAGLTFGQSLSIPTNLQNAIITIKKISLSPNGTNIDGPIILDASDPNNVLVRLDGANLIVDDNGPQWGNVTIGQDLTLSKHIPDCTGTTGCVLTLDNTGKVKVTTSVNPWITEEEEWLWKRSANTNTGVDIFFGWVDSPTAQNDGKNINVRIWVKTDDTTGTWSTYSPDAQLIVRKQIESREWFRIRTTPTATGDINRISWANPHLSSTIINDYDTSSTILNSTKKSTSSDTPGNFIFESDADAGTRVGINTPSGQTPAANLHVAGANDTFLVGDGQGRCISNNPDPNTNVCYAKQCTTSAQCGIHGKNTVCTADTNIVWGSACGLSNTTLFADSSIWRVGINTKFPQQSLDVIGRASISNNLIIGHPSGFNPGSDRLAVNGSTRANAYYYNSDRRYKSDITALQSPLENLLKISGYRYHNTLSDKADIGVIAQEVEAVYPALVQTDAAGYKSVQYGNLVAPIIEAIRELAQKVENLTAKLDSLFSLTISQQSRIDTLEARLSALESR